MLVILIEKREIKKSPDVKHPALGLGLCGGGCQELPAAAVNGEGVWLGSGEQKCFNIAKKYYSQIQRRRDKLYAWAWCSLEIYFHHFYL